MRREEISKKPESEWRNIPSYRAYAVLTLCRILYSFRRGTIVSKQRAARWAIKYLAEEWGEIILQALETEDAKRSHSRILPTMRVLNVSARKP
jgi:hypothetical protein